MTTKLYAPFEGPRALDLLAEFRKKYIAVIERRIAELRARINEHSNDGMVKSPSDEIRAAFEEYDALRYVEPELHRMINAFVTEAQAPFHRILADAMATNPHFTLTTKP